MKNYKPRIPIRTGNSWGEEGAESQFIMFAETFVELKIIEN